MKTSTFLIALCLFITPCHAAIFEMGTYQDKTGVITVMQGGNSVDPYFANKALLIAHDGGLDITKAGKRWITWAIAHQQDNGLFSRYCRKSAGAAWQHCQDADADDALLALWLKLLYTLSPSSGMPAEWKASAAKAETQLQSLLDTETGIYHVSKTLPVGLLMDNIEIYNALQSVSQQMKRMGKEKKSANIGQKASALKQAIYKNFWQADNQRFRITTQLRDANDFYPDKVAQIFPLLYALPIPNNRTPAETFADWTKQYMSEWFHLIASDFPWGLVAVTATQVGDSNTAFCWQNKAASFRHGFNWNILEESTFQRITLYLKNNAPTATVACMEAPL